MHLLRNTQASLLDEDEDRGNVLATVQDLSASSDTSVPKTVTFPDPPLMVPGQSYFLVMRVRLSISAYALKLTLT